MKISRIFLMFMFFVLTRTDIVCLNSKILELVELDMTQQHASKAYMSNGPVMQVKNELTSQKDTKRPIIECKKGILLAGNKPSMRS